MPRKKSEISPYSGATIVDSVASADGVTIHYDVRGVGEPTLVFIHCWCCDRSCWDAQVDTFAKNYKVVTIDLAGHGESVLDREKLVISIFSGANKAAIV